MTVDLATVDVPFWSYMVLWGVLWFLVYMMGLWRKRALEAEQQLRDLLSGKVLPVRVHIEMEPTE